MKTLLISVSGGRTSMFLARLCQTSPMFEGRPKYYVYANTGKEKVETLEFIDRCDRFWGLGVVWLEAVVDPMKGNGTRHKIVNYQTATRNTDESKQGHPFFDVIEKYGLPSNAFPHCTRELKLQPIASYMRSIGIDDYDTAIGIRADEPSRATAKEGVIYPLVDLRISEEMVRNFWDRQDFDLELKDYQGNCDLCFKKSLRKRLTILRESPEIAGFWSALEGPRTSAKGVLNNLVFDRDGLSVDTLVKMSADPSLELAIDKHDARLAKGPELFELSCGINWDFETNCVCRSI